MANLVSLQDELTQKEMQVPHLRPNCEKEIVWGGEPGQQTEWSVLFIHGFSATKHEIRPLPDLIAKAFGANIFFTRLAGHGQDGDAMGAATLQDWQMDTVEAFDVGHKLGKRVFVIGCSTGCTLSALYLANGGTADALVQVSPNYGLRFWPAQKLLEWPVLHPLHSLTIGRDLILKPKSPEHENYWTMKYPLSAVSATAEAVKLAEETDLAKIATPTFFAVNPKDMVISPQAAAEAADRWGGPVEYHELTQTPDDDMMGHVMAGDVFSPNQTRPLARRILDWSAKI